MSTEVLSKGHRHSRSAAIPPPAASSQNPQNPRNPHHLNAQAHSNNSQSAMDYPVHPTTPPRTPRREYSTPNITSMSANMQDGGSKQKSRNKNRPKNVMTSPNVTRSGRHTPPLTGAQSANIPSTTRSINTPSTAAYAGPTFHASPAPSALPIPSFYSKSVPDSPDVKGMKSLREVTMSSNLSTPPSALPEIDRSQREESPLDFFFKADREEKARARSASSTQTSVAPTGPFPPPGNLLRSNQTPPAPVNQTRSHQGHIGRSSASGIFAMELDGENPRTPIGPAFSTPYSERINAARSPNQPWPVEQSSSPRHGIDRSEALKAYLFSGHVQPSPTITKPLDKTTHSNTVAHTSSWNAGLSSSHNIYPVSYDGKTLNNSSKASGRSSGLRQEVTPTKTPNRTPLSNANYSDFPTPSRVPETSSSHQYNPFGNRSSHSNSPISAPLLGMSSVNKGPDIQGMEDSLRKILKLEPAGTVGISEGDLPAARVPVSYGSRPPPTNGMHNGVMRS